jgi:hypothetical protein
MNEYIFKLEGKEKGAIGALCGFTKVIEAIDIEKAILSLYDHYDHVIKLEVWNEKKERWDFARKNSWDW